LRKKEFELIVTAKGAAMRSAVDAAREMAETLAATSTSGP